MFTVYALHSPSTDKIYVGFTSDLQQRLLSHNELGHGWTASFRPWIVIYTEELNLKEEAINRERQLKSAVGRTFIRTLLKR